MPGNDADDVPRPDHPTLEGCHKLGGRFRFGKASFTDAKPGSRCAAICRTEGVAENWLHPSSAGDRKLPRAESPQLSLAISARRNPRPFQNTFMQPVLPGTVLPAMPLRAEPVVRRPLAAPAGFDLLLRLGRFHQS